MSTIKSSHVGGVNKLRSLRVFLLVSLCFLSVQPWIVWDLNNLFPVIGLFYMFIVCFTTLKRRKYTVLPFLLIIYMLIPRTYEIISFKAALITSIAFVTFLQHEDDDVKTEVFQKFVKLFSTLLVPGIILYLVHYVIKLPFFIIPSRNLVLVQEYRNFGFFVEAVQDVDAIPRFRFIFDEAGVVGTVCFYLLLFLRYDFKPWRNKIILLAGLLSFSLFFYIGSFIMFFMMKITSVKRMLITVVTVLIVVIALSNTEVFNTLIYSRITNAQDLIGEQRTQEVFNAHYDKYVQTPQLAIGNGMGSEFALEERKAAIASYKVYIYEYGIGGVLLLVVIYYKLIRKVLNPFNSILAILGLLLCWYQRPWISDYYNTILIFCGIYMVRDKLELTKKGTTKPSEIEEPSFEGDVKGANNSLSF